jgi:hypothetical protein
MDTQISSIESVTKSELLGLASWDQQRSAEQLLDFISRREAEIFSTNE